jgi:hypothetical protein
MKQSKNSRGAYGLIVLIVVIGLVFFVRSRQDGVDRGAQSDPGLTLNSQPAGGSADQMSLESIINLVPRNDALSALALANEWKTRYPQVLTYVTADAVHFRFPDDRTVDVPLPADRMVLAAAPYLTATHPCAVHTMSSCQGELRNTPVTVTLIDSDGNVVLTERAATLENGFVEFWVPRGGRYLLRIEALGKSVETTVESFRDSATCLTNLQLS